MKQATFGAGCFWGVEAAFRRLPGVLETAVGYAGGGLENPSYEDVCTGSTGHAEVVRVEYDPDQISYRDLLETFWEIHDPTTRDRQGPDIGSQYRSVIFFHDGDQEAVAHASRQKLEDEARYAAPVVTEILPAGPFYRAEEYHQRYLEKRGEASCRVR